MANILFPTVLNELPSLNVCSSSWVSLISASSIGIWCTEAYVKTTNCFRQLFSNNVSSAFHYSDCSQFLFNLKGLYLQDFTAGRRILRASKKGVLKRAWQHRTCRNFLIESVLQIINHICGYSWICAADSWCWISENKRSHLPLTNYNRRPLDWFSDETFDNQHCFLTVPMHLHILPPILIRAQN